MVFLVHLGEGVQSTLVYTEGSKSVIYYGVIYKRNEDKNCIAKKLFHDRVTLS